ncbi:hypothetical protein [Mycetohabitans endofungorum]|uniref:hypothetical protein n=1 Tax=Mycetohabitans endofungorum TaxID=417203 RepID=UPI00396AAAA4
MIRPRPNPTPYPYGHILEITVNPDGTAIDNEWGPVNVSAPAALIVEDLASLDAEQYRPTSTPRRLHASCPRR